MVAKKYNKSKEQKPNYSKRGNNKADVGKEENSPGFSIESGTDFDLANKIKEQKNKNLCLEDNGDQCFNPRKK